MINSFITYTNPNPGLINVLGWQEIDTFPQILFLFGLLFLLTQNVIPKNMTFRYLIPWQNKARLFMDRLHVKVNVITLPSELNHFPWGGDHTIPYIEPILVKCMNPIILLEKSPVFLNPDCVHCWHI